MSSDSRAESVKKFQDFDWKDERWQAYLKNLYPLPSAIQLIKWKKKWYQKNVDSTFDVTADCTTDKAASGSGSSQRNTAPTAAGVPSYAHYMRPNPTVPNWMKFPATLSLLTGIVFAVFYTLPVWGQTLASQFYTWSWLSFFVGLVLDIGSKYGVPQLNTEWWSGMMMEDSAQALMFVVLTITMPRNPIAFLPSAITGILQASESFVLYRNYLPAYISGNATVSAMASKVNSQRMKWMQVRSDIEVALGGVLLIMVFLSRGNGILCIFLYFHFIKARYAMSGFTNSTFRKLDGKLMSILTSTYCPSVLMTIYTKAKSLLSWQVDRNRPSSSGSRMCTVQ